MDRGRTSRLNCPQCGLFARRQACFLQQPLLNATPIYLSSIIRLAGLTPQSGNVRHFRRAKIGSIRTSSQ
jgi:hypothetical protein